MKYLLIWGASIFFLLNTAYSQQDSVWLEEVQNNEIEISTSESEDNLLFDYYEDLFQNPVNINTADLNDLLRIPGMNNTDAFKMLEYKKNTGHIFSLFELYSIQGIDAGRLKTYFPYICVQEQTRAVAAEPEAKTYLVSDLRSRINTDIQNQKGFQQNNYQGSKYKVYNRFKLRSNNKYYFGFLSEKDPGEKDFMDHTAMYFQIKKRGLIKSFIAGDYNIEFGKGIAIWSPYGFSGSVNAFDRAGRKALPYLSTNESQFLRGAAVNMNYSRFELSAFYSNRIKDGNIDSSNYTILSLSTDGYHRTKHELSKVETFREIVSGASLDFISDYLSGGVLFYQLNTNYFFSPGSNYPSGNTFRYLSFAYSLSLKKLLCSGEISLFRNNIASLSSINFNASENIKLIFIVRNTPGNYFSFLSAAKRHESGVYAGISATSIPGELNLSYDSYKSQSTRDIFPSTGNELLVDYSISPEKNILCRFRYRKNDQLSFVNYTSYGIKKQSVMSEVTYKISNAIKWKCRIDYSLYSEPSIKLQETGYAFYQEVVYLFPNKSAELYGRITMFDTKSYKSRVYLFEKDVTGSFSMNPLYDEGMRWYIGININLIKGFKLQCRYSETYKPDAEFLGSGYNEIIGNLDNQFSLQIDIKM